MDKKHTLAARAIHAIVVPLLCLLITIPAAAQDFSFISSRDPTLEFATYGIDFNGPPVNAPLLLLPPIPSLAGPVTPWFGVYIDPISGPVFDFNLQVESPTVSELVISDGDPVGGGPAPGVTCLVVGGCEPIMFVLPFAFQPGPLFVDNFAVQVELSVTDFLTSLDASNALLSLAFIDPNQPLVANPLALLPAFGPSLIGPQLVFPDPLGPPLVPFSIGPTSTLPIPPNPALGGLELMQQSLVIDPFAPVFQISGLAEGETVQLGKSFHINVTALAVPEPPAILLFVVRALLFVMRRLRKTTSTNG